MSHDRVQTLEKLYAEGQVSPVIDLALEKALAYERGEAQHQLAQLEQDLAEFEQEYGLTSDGFYARFEAGEMGDAVDFVEWASLFQMAQRLQDRIALLGAD